MESKVTKYTCKRASDCVLNGGFWSSPKNARAQVSPSPLTKTTPTVVTLPTPTNITDFSSPLHRALSKHTTNTLSKKATAAQFGIPYSTFAAHTLQYNKTTTIGGPTLLDKQQEDALIDR